MNPRPLVEVSRAGLTESIHHGSIAVVNPDGDLLASWSNPNQICYLRSCAKPFQALPLLTSGAADHFGYSSRDLAITCSSHHGHPEQLRLLRALLERLELEPDWLKCGVHEPLGERAAQTLLRAGQKPNVLHNNCAGKHLGMLAACKKLGYELPSYLALKHPLQQQILAAVAAASGVAQDEIKIGTDGCSAPNFALPLAAAARAYARLAEAGGGQQSELHRLYRAMTGHPALISGPKQLDAVLMQVGGGNLVAKSGAEGMLAIGLSDSSWGPLGIALKVWDGDASGRARSAAAVELLEQLDWFSEEDRQRVEAVLSPEIRNHRGDFVGRVAASFRVELTDG